MTASTPPSRMRLKVMATMISTRLKPRWRLRMVLMAERFLMAFLDLPCMSVQELRIHRELERRPRTGRGVIPIAPADRDPEDVARLSDRSVCNLGSAGVVDGRQRTGD